MPSLCDRGNVFYILINDKTKVLGLKGSLEQLISDATNVCVKEDEIKKEKVRQKETREKYKKRLEEQHREGKNIVMNLLTTKTISEVDIKKIRVSPI